MPYLEHDPGPNPECPDCGHAPIHHIQDGLRATCMICGFLAMQASELGRRIPKVCSRRFEFKLSLAERMQAMKADKASYEQQAICAHPHCGYEWRSHWGFLCPSGDSTFVPMIESKQPFLITH